MTRPVDLVIVCMALATGGITTVASWPAQPQPPALVSPAAGRSDVTTAALRAYSGRLAEVAAPLPANASLTAIIGPIMALAGARATTSDPVLENRTALIALAFYVNGWPLEWLAPEARPWPRPVARTMVLRGRHDLAQHFAVSAVIAAAAGTPAAVAAGLYKELGDARRASGFSFSDLAADQAGTRFGQVATRSAESARHLQVATATGVTEDAIMPSVTGLVDNLTQAELTSRYGGVGAPAYLAVVSDIEQRVAALSLLR